jgi:hypothetical protein
LALQEQPEPRVLGEIEAQQVPQAIKVHRVRRVHKDKLVLLVLLVPKVPGENQAFQAPADLKVVEFLQEVLQGKF